MPESTTKRAAASRRRESSTPAEPETLRPPASDPAGYTAADREEWREFFENAGGHSVPVWDSLSSRWRAATLADLETVEVIDGDGKLVAQFADGDLGPRENTLRDPRWEALAAPFPPEEIEKLPRNLIPKDNNKGRCEDTPKGRQYSADGYFCGGWHARAIHLDYVGHAGITMRLNEVVGPENWDHRPFALSDQGLPLKVGGEFWATLTILGVTKMDVAENFSSTQEAWGDSLRRLASRFGVGTYLWGKSERALALRQANDTSEAESQQAEQSQPPGQQPAPQHIQELLAILGGLNDDQADTLRAWWRDQALPPAEHLSPQQAAQIRAQVDGIREAAAHELLEQRLGAQRVES